MNLHIGGTTARDGWQILNINPGPGIDHVGDFRDLGRFADRSFDNVYASHVLEHVAQAQVVPTLRGLHHILRDGGNLFVSVPDLDVLCHTFISPHASADVKWATMRMMYGGQVDQHDFHYVGFSEPLLANLLAQAGFTDVRRVASFGLFQDTS